MMVRETFQLDNIHCPSCVAKIEKAVGAMRGVSSARMAFATGRLAVDYDPTVIEPGAIAATVSRLGYPARSIRRQELGS
ncbi:MAG: heavy-metal-associated domain-containing protein [Limnochordaceae bacterium]|nr:heavy-metal-associated domain-containing protein [Limnochordaceae bacterium]